jgi:hypothetical protein
MEAEASKAGDTATTEAEVSVGTRGDCTTYCTFDLNLLLVSEYQEIPHHAH